MTATSDTVAAPPAAPGSPLGRAWRRLGTRIYLGRRGVGRLLAAPFGRTQVVTPADPFRRWASRRWATGGLEDQARAGEEQLLVRSVVLLHDLQLGMRLLLLLALPLLTVIPAAAVVAWAQDGMLPQGADEARQWMQLIQSRQVVTALSIVWLATLLLGYRLLPRMRATLDCLETTLSERGAAEAENLFVAALRAIANDGRYRGVLAGQACRALAGRRALVVRHGAGRLLRRPLAWLLAAVLLGLNGTLLWQTETAAGLLRELASLATAGTGGATQPGGAGGAGPDGDGRTPTPVTTRLLPQGRPAGNHPRAGLEAARIDFSADPLLQAATQRRSDAGATVAGGAAPMNPDIAPDSSFGDWVNATRSDGVRAGGAESPDDYAPYLRR